MSPNLAVLFAALAEDLSFSKAAARLNMSQPSLSAHVKKLEAQIGFKLYTRAPTGIVLTPAGERLAPLARQLSLTAMALKDEARAIAAAAAVETIVGSCLPSRDLAKITRINEQFFRQFPSLPLRFTNDSTHNLLAELKHGDISLAIVMAPFDATDLEIQSLTRLRAHFLFPADHPLSAVSEIAPGMLSGTRVTVPSRAMHSTWFDETMAPLVNAGVALQEAPDSTGEALVEYARFSKTVVLRYSNADYIADGGPLASRPAVGLPHAEIFLVRLRNFFARGADRYWQLAKQMDVES